MPDNGVRKPATIVQVQDAWARHYIACLDRLDWHATHVRVRGQVVDRRLRRWDPFWADKAEKKSPWERLLLLRRRLAATAARARRQHNARARQRRRSGCGAGVNR